MKLSRLSKSVDSTQLSTKDQEELESLKTFLGLDKSFPESELRGAMDRYNKIFQDYSREKEYSGLKLGLETMSDGLLAEVITKVDGRNVTLAEVRDLESRFNREPAGGNASLQKLGLRDVLGEHGEVRIKANDELVDKVDMLNAKYKEYLDELDSLKMAPLALTTTNLLLKMSPKTRTETPVNYKGSRAEFLREAQIKTLQSVNLEVRNLLGKMEKPITTNQKVKNRLEEKRLVAVQECAQILIRTYNNHKEQVIADITSSQEKAKRSIAPVKKEAQEPDRTREPPPSPYRENQDNINRFREDSAPTAVKILALYKQHAKLVERMLGDEGKLSAHSELGYEEIVAHNNTILERIPRLQAALNNRIEDAGAASESVGKDLRGQMEGGIRKDRGYVNEYDDLRDRLQSINAPLEKKIPRNAESKARTETNARSAVSMPRSPSMDMVAPKMMSTSSATISPEQPTISAVQDQTKQSSPSGRGKTHASRKSLDSGAWEQVISGPVEPKSRFRQSNRPLATSTESPTVSSTSQSSVARNWKQPTLNAKSQGATAPHQGPGQGWAVSRAENATKVAIPVLPEAGTASNKKDSGDSSGETRSRSPSLSK